MTSPNEIVLVVGELKGALKAVAEATKDNTEVLKTVTAYMHKTIGATEEREKNYRRVKHTAFGSVVISVGVLIRAIFS